MKTAKEWAEQIRSELGNGLRYDPVEITGKSLIECIVEEIQWDARAGEPEQQQVKERKE